MLDPDEHRVSAFFSLGESRDAPTFGVRSKYYRTWVLANGGPPRQGQTTNPDVIADPSLAFTVNVSDATTDGENQVKDDALVYSRIDKIIRVKRPSGPADMHANIEAAKYSPF